MTSEASLLAVDDLSVTYDLGSVELRAVTDASIAVAQQESVGLVGESGSGKSTLARAITGLLPRRARVTGGTITLAGRSATAWTEGDWQTVRGRVVSIVFQDPMSFLNPVLRVGRQIDEAVAMEDSSSSVRSRTLELLDLVRLPTSRASAYPHELSGGMRQRALLAIAVASRPQLLIADEPTTALDVTVQAEILQLLADIRRETRMSLLFISHDLRVVSGLCSRVYVMYAGRVVEHGRRQQIFGAPKHPYTVGLLEAARISQDADGLFATIDGEPPNLMAPQEGCPFMPRCGRRMPVCGEMPPAIDLGDQSIVRCWAWDSSLHESVDGN